VLAGSLDVVVAEVTAAEQEPALSVERVGERGGVFYCRAGHPLLSRPRMVFADLLAFPLAMNPLPGRLAPFLERAGPAGRFEPASGHFLPAISLDSVSLMKRAVRDTDAVSWAPEVLVAAELREGSFVALPVSAPWARLNYGVIRRAHRPMTPAVEMFLVELREEERRISVAEPSRRRSRSARPRKR
jgi:DNA-binding transcriptional LysR family regulator